MSQPCCVETCQWFIEDKCAVYAIVILLKAILGELQGGAGSKVVKKVVPKKEPKVEEPEPEPDNEKSPDEPGLMTMPQPKNTKKRKAKKK